MVTYDMTAPTVSKRLINIPESPIRKLAKFAEQAQKKGIKIFHLNIGDPDIRTPAVLVDCLHHWQDNPIAYDQSQGNKELLTSLKLYYHSLGFNFVKTENIQVTSGASEAILMAFLAVTEAGDEIITVDPGYPNYRSFAVSAGIKLVPIETRLETGFHLPDKQTIERLITRKTKAILICNPNNPTGTVYTKKELDMLVEIAKRHKLFFICDEVYREFCYGKNQHVSILNYLKQLREQMILIDSLSKRYSACGLRVGCLVSFNPQIIAGVLRIAQGRLSVGYIDQKVASQLSKVSRGYLDDVKKEYQGRRDFLFNLLKTIPGVSTYLPEGAFYLMVRLPVNDVEDFCRWLLTDFSINRSTVMLAPGPGFYLKKNQGKNEVRVAYVLKIPDLKHSIEILDKGLRKYNR